MKLIKYSLTLGAIFFFAAILPGIICLLCGFDAVVASSGIGLATVCWIKGLVAKRIFGPETYHKSSPNAAIGLVIFSIISAIVHIVTDSANREAMQRLGYVYDNSFDAKLSAFTPLVIASLFWGIVLAIVVYIRGRQNDRKHLIESQSRA